MFENLLAIFGPAAEVVSSAIGTRAEGLARRRDFVRDDVVQCLRAVYFTPDGLRDVLQVIADGGTPSDETIQSVLIDFNDAEWAVDRALHGLAFDRLGERPELSLRAADQLNQLRYGKINVRRDLQRALNKRLTMGRPVDPRVARELLTNINALNSLIVELEEEHNYRARDR